MFYLVHRVNWEYLVFQVIQADKDQRYRPICSAVIYRTVYLNTIYFVTWATTIHCSSIKIEDMEYGFVYILFFKI